MSRTGIAETKNNLGSRWFQAPGDHQVRTPIPWSWKLTAKLLGASNRERRLATRSSTAIV